MGVLGNNIRLGSSAAGGYEIKKSLRFNGADTAYLHRTGSTGNRKTWTMSFWIKLSAVDRRMIVGAYVNSNQVMSIEREASGLIAWYDYTSGYNYRLRTNREFRDLSSWYHLVFALDTTQGTSSNRCKMWVNGVQESSFTSETYPSQNHDGYWNHNIQHSIGTEGSNVRLVFNGYMSDFHFLDGIVATPSDFAETHEDTGQWVPKKYIGTYGSQGYYLNFQDNSGTTATTLGKDSSGNGNNFTPNNFGTGDAVKDTPSNNFCTLLALMPSAQTSFSQGNLYADLGATHKTVYGDLGVKTDKWYWEGRAMDGGTDKFTYGLSDIENTKNTQVSGTNYLLAMGSATYAHGDAVSIYGDDLRKNGSVVTSSAIPDEIEDNDIVSMAFDADTGKVWFALNGTWANGSGTASTTLDPSNHDTTVTIGKAYTPGFCGETSDWFANFGQDSSFANNVTAQGNTDSKGKGDFYYAVPSGFKALCTANLPDATVINEISTSGNEHFMPLTYTGNGGENGRTGLGFSPDLVWIKSRSHAHNNSWFDTVRGANAEITSNSNSAEATGDVQLVKSFDADGFTLGTNAGVNGNGKTFVAWCWKESATAGFDIVGYTGNGSVRTISHSLNAVPEMIIYKIRSTTDTWIVYHKGIGATKFLMLNGANGEQTGTNYFNNTTPTSSVFTVGTDTSVNRSGGTHIAYLFSSVEGYSKCGEYTGNGDAQGPFVYTGFKPMFVMLKATNGNNWAVFDNKRDQENGMDERLHPNLDIATNSGAGQTIDFLSNGFKITTSDSLENPSGYKVVYLAIAERPFKYSNAH